MREGVIHFELFGLKLEIRQIEGLSLGGFDPINYSSTDLTSLLLE